MHLIKSLKEIIKTVIPNSLLMHQLPKQARRSVLLTFDDGPDPELTPLVLERLAKFNARAVFFVVGEKIIESPQIFDKIISNGHIIGNHSFKHPNRIISSTHEFRKEFIKCSEVIQSKTGQKVNLIRPPLGISFAALKVSKLMGTKIILWSIEGGEWGVNKHDSTEKIIMRLKKKIKPRDILLLHDNNQQTIQILDGILPFLKENHIDLSNGINYLKS
jgi:peptidoglycan-N-acetylglucosamine deacetylase